MFSQVIIDFAPYPNGSLPDAQVAAAHTLGDFIRGCYGKPAAATSGNGARTYTLSLPPNTTVDRVVVAEDQTRGQLVRTFVITGVSPSGTTLTLASGYRWVRSQDGGQGGGERDREEGAGRSCCFCLQY